MLAMYLELILMYSLKAMLLSLTDFEIQTRTFICEPICNIISATTLCM